MGKKRGDLFIKVNFVNKNFMDILNIKFLFKV